MTYKIILVQADQTSNSVERIRIAIRLAQQQGAHLIGAAVTGGPGLLPYPGALGLNGGAGYGAMLGARADVLREQAEQAIALYEAAARAEELRSHEGVVLDDEAGGALSLRARYSDLVLIGQTKPDDSRLAVPADLPQYMVMSCGRPVLLIPFAGSFATLGRFPMVAWDGSLSAARAVSGALPLLERAERVDVVVFGGDADDVDGAQAGDDIALYLARHDVKVNLIRAEGGIGGGRPLLSLASDRGADLIVMGGYGHARLREFVLGGVTRTLLNAMNLPVLMAH
jgi:nucleotide-binding universal stress UspA family protein